MMDASSMFRGRLRKRGSEGVTKKGPLMAKHPVSSKSVPVSAGLHSKVSSYPSSSYTCTPEEGASSPQHSTSSAQVRSPLAPSMPGVLPSSNGHNSSSPVRRIYDEVNTHSNSRSNSTTPRTRTRPPSPASNAQLSPSSYRPSPPTSPKLIRQMRPGTPTSPTSGNMKPRPRPQSPRTQTDTGGSSAGPYSVSRVRAESPVGTSGIPRKIKYLVNVSSPHNISAVPGMTASSPTSSMPKDPPNVLGGGILYRGVPTPRGASPTGAGQAAQRVSPNRSNYRGISPNNVPKSVSVNYHRGTSPKGTSAGGRASPHQNRGYSPTGAASGNNNNNPVAPSRRRESALPTGIPKREPSPVLPSCSSSPSPGGPRGVSPNGACNNPRQASPSGMSTRGTSPRGASPGSRGSSSSGVSEEVVRGRVRRAVRARLYLLHQPGPNSFSVGGDSPTHKYKVIIGPQSCSCGHSPHCVHVLFVMVRVLQVPENSPVLLAPTLKDYEAEQLLGSWEERRKKAVRARERHVHTSPGGRSSPSRVSPSSATATTNTGSSATPRVTQSSGDSTAGGGGGSKIHNDEGSGEEDDAQCPICLTVMVEGESLVACESGCHNLLHHHCMAVWAADRHSQKLPLLCPLCRAPWPSKSNPRLLASSDTANTSYSEVRYTTAPVDPPSVVPSTLHRRAYSADDTSSAMEESGYGTVGGIIPPSSLSRYDSNATEHQGEGDNNNYYPVYSNVSEHEYNVSSVTTRTPRHHHHHHHATPVIMPSHPASSRAYRSAPVIRRSITAEQSYSGVRGSPSAAVSRNGVSRSQSQNNQNNNVRHSPVSSPLVPNWGANDISTTSQLRTTRASPSIDDHRGSSTARVSKRSSSATRAAPSRVSPSLVNSGAPYPQQQQHARQLASNANSNPLPVGSRVPLGMPPAIIPGSYYPPTLRGEVSAAMVANVGEDEVPLPRSEPIPVEHEESAAAWVVVFGRELVACLFSRDWAVRETGLRRLAHEVVKVLHWDQLVTGEETRKKVVHCCANILAQVVNDPVYKVYLACLRVVRILLSHLTLTVPGEVSWLQELLRPLLHTLLLKCADGNRRTSQISVDSLLELSRGQEGELALGGGQGLSLGGVQYVLSCILDEAPPQEAPWQWLLGRLCVLDRLLDQFPEQFQIQMVSLQPLESGYKLQHYDRLMTVVEFAFKALGSSHATVAKLARRVYICGAKMAAAEPNVFRHVCDMLGKLDISLQMRLKRRLRSLHSQHARPVIGRLSDHPLHKPRSQLESNIRPYISTALPRLVRSVSHSPSRLLSTARSPSQSPARPANNDAPVITPAKHHIPNSQLPTPVYPSDINEPSTSTSNTRTPQSSNALESNCSIDSNSKPNPPSVKQSPPRPTHLPLDSIHLNFKDKQARVKQYHRSRPRQEEPIIVQHALITPKANKNQSKASQSSNRQGANSNQPSSKGNETARKSSALPLRKGGLSQSHGDNLDLSPRTPIGPHLPNFTLKEAIASPTTPDPPFTTPVNEVTHPIMSAKLQSDVDTLEYRENLAKTNDDGDPPELPLPKIPYLTLLPPYLEQDIGSSQERIAEAPCRYEENSEWKRGQVLGSGAFSCCYQARDIATGTIMAVKVVSFVCNSSEEQERVEAAVEDEILLMSQLRHRNIVRLIGSVRYSTSFCVFTEWMAGGSVSTLLERYGAFSESVILSYTKQVLRGLSYLHDNMILHRDLKGANLLIDSTGDWLRIGDFGTAARLAHKSTVAGEFQGQLLGTIAFMAPEVLRGDNYGRACDIWSVGCCIIEMASTKPPWDADHVSNQFKLMFKIATSNGPPLVPEHLSEGTRQMALDCLQSVSDKRPTAKDLLQRLVLAAPSVE